QEESPAHLNTRTPEHLNTPPLILSVGTLIPEKGFEYVIRACRILADRGIGYDCLIVGDGPHRAKLQELVRLLDLGDRVTLGPYWRRSCAARCRNSAFRRAPPASRVPGQAEFTGMNRMNRIGRDRTKTSRGRPLCPCRPFPRLFIPEILSIL